MSLEGHVNVGLILAIVVIVQIVKQYICLKNNKIWDAIVFCLGIGCAAIVFGIDNLYTTFNIFLFLSTAFMHAAAAILAYKTGRMGIDGIKNVLEKNKTDL